MCEKTVKVMMSSDVAAKEQSWSVWRLLFTKLYYIQMNGGQHFAIHFPDSAIVKGKVSYVIINIIHCPSYEKTKKRQKKKKIMYSSL